jgi:hypothetical protein
MPDKCWLWQAEGLFLGNIRLEGEFPAGRAGNGGEVTYIRNTVATAKNDRLLKQICTTSIHGVEGTYPYPTNFAAGRAL